MKLKLIGDSILAYMPKGKLNGEEERHAIENAETALLRKLYPEYKDSLSDINIFCLGINDYFRQYYDENFRKMTTQEIISGLTEFIGEIKKDNNGELIVLSLLPIRQVYPWSNHYSVINKEIPVVNCGLEKYCKENNISFVDTYSSFVNENCVMSEDLSDDGIHPNQTTGYDKLAELINKEIERIREQGDCYEK